MSSVDNSAPPERAPSESEAKRAAILRQAVEVFADEGYRHSDVQVIADRASVGKGTVYRYFGNKEDLFWATVFHVFEGLREHILGASGKVEGTLPKVKAACLAYAEFFETHPKCLEVFVQDRAMFRGACPESHREHHEKLLERFIELLDEGIARGEVRSVDSRTTMVALAGAVYGTVVHSCYMPGAGSLVERAERMIDIFLAGLRHLPSDHQRECDR